jgi:hypothetical protein
MRNNRIGANGFLNQRCALAPDLESILRARMSKIVFRQHRPVADSDGIGHQPAGYEISWPTRLTDPCQFDILERSPSSGRLDAI